jgi:molybdopterin-binding protein
VTESLIWIGAVGRRVEVRRSIAVRVGDDAIRVSRVCADGVRTVISCRRFASEDWGGLLWCGRSFVGAHHGEGRESIGVMIEFTTTVTVVSTGTTQSIADAILIKGKRAFTLCRAERISIAVVITTAICRLAICLWERGDCWTVSSTRVGSFGE